MCATEGLQEKFPPQKFNITLTQINESTPKTNLCMKMSEKFKIEEEGERPIPRLGSERPGDIQAIEPRSGWVALSRSLSYVEERPP